MEGNHAFPPPGRAVLSMGTGRAASALTVPAPGTPAGAPEQEEAHSRLLQSGLLGVLFPTQKEGVEGRETVGDAKGAKRERTVSIIDGEKKKKLQ